MSRVIKFRVWDLACECYVKRPWKLYLNGGVSISGWANDVVLEQYTGRCDKNGVEIYEGDILNEPVSSVGGPDGGYRYKSRVIEWDGAGKGYGLFAPEAASIVIGNIHSNPELLESTK